MAAKKVTNYKVKKIFIGSPGDVPKERKIFPEIIKRVNRLKANSMGVQLEAIGWEDTLPGKGRPRPQSNINEDLLKCNLIIMLLWNRWGSETGKYSSGFEEEYELADSISKSIWIFFKDISKEMLADPGEQLKKVLEFRDRTETENKYLFIRYKNEKDWKKILEEFLCDWLDEVGPITPQGILPATPPGFQGLQDAEDYKISLSKLNADVDEYISKQIKNAFELSRVAKEFADKGRISKAEEYYTKALSISNDPVVVASFIEFLVRIGDLDKAQEKLDLLMEIANSTNNNRLKSVVFNDQAIIVQTKGDLIESEKLILKALNVDDELGNKLGKAASYGNLGIIKSTQGKLEEAENIYNKSLELYVEIGDKEGMASVYGNLGNIKRELDNLEEAESLFNKSLELFEELDHKEGMANAYGNLGLLMSAQDNIEEAENLYNKSLEIQLVISSKEGMAATYTNLAVIKINQDDIEGAEILHKKALELNIKLGRKKGIAIVYGNLAKIKMFQGKLEEAKILLTKTMKIWEFIGNAENMKKAKNLIAKIESEIKKNKK
ncbi:MAG: tetratricopeptide repeat protein [Candidatus Marinimicrobia bacterium]|nr:tetratricopeptide repeat protein [Candidatus Neomarinimicrobiota bacterium]